MKSTIYLGTFDSESWWRSPNLSTLPSMNNKKGQSITMGMDDLLFPLCKKHDILFTRHPIDEHLKDYLSLIGYTFRNIHCKNSVQSKDYNLNVFDILISDESYYKKLLPKDSLLSPYSVISGANELVQKFSFYNLLPFMETVREMNSKIYSHGLREKMGMSSISFIAEHSDDLLTYGFELLKTGQVLVKDPFGVSGKGNVLIPNERVLKRIASYLREQEHTGKETLFLIEPYLNKAEDFSCQMFITEHGEVELISVQKMINQSFSYSGSYPANAEFMDGLQRNNYFGVMYEACNELFASGYHGDVCIDSMLLASNEIVPIVEINARKSMGLINHHLNTFLQDHSLFSFLTFISLGYSTEVTMLQILEALRANELLFTPENKRGIIPLSSNTIFGSKDTALEEPELQKGKLYLAAPYSYDVSEALTLINRVKEILKSLAFKVYN